MKYKIEKNTVQETLILPLYSRKLCTELYPNLYRDLSENAYLPVKPPHFLSGKRKGHIY